jgi:tyrosinase
MPVRVRRDVYGLPEWDDVLLWYARAVVHMKQRPLTTPTSWDFQAAVHGRQPEGQKPGVWDECQHETWFFLPWHRAYVYCWETIVQAAIVELGGPGDWSLPYWNYSDERNANARILPPAFRAQKTPDGSDNPLLVERDPQVNAGQPVGPASDVDVSALDEPYFQGSAHGGSTGFGGPVTGFPHHGGGSFGTLETTPHGAVHVDIGGLMQDPDTAAQDPIFWLHHANIDRLWSIWLSTPGHTNPKDQKWRNQTYPLHDVIGKPIQFTAAQVLDTTAGPLSYQYESLTDPRAAPATQFAARVSTPPNEQVPEMLGATAVPVTLGIDDSHARLALEAPSGPGAVQAAAAPSPHRIHLNLENVTGVRATTNYDVYLNLPEGGEPQQHPELLAGVLPTFGVGRASTREDPHTGGSGLHAAFDVTSVVSRLQEAGQWDPGHVRVSFVPRRRDQDQPPVTIGRVSVYITR